MGGKAKTGGRGHRNVPPAQMAAHHVNEAPLLQPPEGPLQIDQNPANSCPECYVPYNDTNFRSFTDTCGHVKCKHCVSTRDRCPQCAASKRAAMSGPPHLEPAVPIPVPEGRYPQDGPSFIEELGHEPRTKLGKSPSSKKAWAGVSSRIPSAEPRRSSVSSEGSTGKATSAAKSSDTAAALEAVKRSARIENRRNSASQNPRDADFIMTGVSSSKGGQKSSSASSVATRSVSPAKERQKLVAMRSPRRASTDEVKVKPVTDAAGPSTADSPEEPMNQDDSRSSSSGDGMDVVNGDDNQPGTSKQPEVKKKKKRNPVTIHDHITVLGGDPPQYQCNVCMKKFKTKAHIKYHEFCQKGEKPFKCEQCGQGFIAKSHYEYHLRTHTGERPYVCPKCGKGFNQRGKVTRHMRSHTGEKPFICQQCGRGFANAQALRSHFLIHTGERPFACQYCNKRFTGMTNLKKHVITHTGERPFQCNHCGKSFGLKWTLDLHLRTHSTERPYACDQCSRAFSNSKDLRRHLVIHSGERPFKCWICGTAFRRKDNLDRHIKNTHNQPKEVAKQLANEAAAEYMAKQNQAKAAAAAGPKKPNILGSKLKNGPSTSKTGGKFRSLADYVPPASEEGVVITADISPSPSPAPKEEIQGPYDDQSIEDPLDLHQPATDGSEENRSTSQTFSIVLTSDGKFVREASASSSHETTPQIVNVCSIASSENESVATLTDDDGPNDLSNDKGARPSTSGSSLPSANSSPTLVRASPSSAQGSSSASPVGGDINGRSFVSSEALNSRKSPSPDPKTLHPKLSWALRRETEEREAQKVISPIPMSGNGVKIVSHPTFMMGKMNAGVNVMTDYRSDSEHDYHASHVVSMSPVKFHQEPASYLVVGQGQDEKIVQTCEKGIQCIPQQENAKVDQDNSEHRRRSYQISMDTQEVFLTNGHGQPTVHQILSPKPAYYQVPAESSDRRPVVYLIQHPQSAPSPQETLVYTNSNAVATEVIRESRVRYATSSQAPARIVDAASGKTIRYTTLGPEAGPSSAMSQYQAQPSVRFVYQNGDTASESDSSDSMLVYACAAAQAEAPSAANEGRPREMKLLYAEAVGVRTPDDNGHVQLMYTAAHPNQRLAPSPNQNVQIYAPAILKASGDNSELQMLVSQRPRVQQQGGSPLPVEVMYRGNTVMAQTVNFPPHEMNLLRRNLNGTVSRVETVSRSPNPGATVVLSSQREIRNHHNYATSNDMPAVLAAERFTRSPQCVLVKEDGGNGKQVQLARAIATVRQMQEDESDYQRSAQNGPESRHNGESIPHRGPRKQYLASQQPK